MSNKQSLILLSGALAAMLAFGCAHAAQPIPIEALARTPALQSVTMDPDGKHIVGLIPSPTNKDETALATWDTSRMPSAPTVVTPSGPYMKFIAAFALKADKILAVARQEWTGELAGCGEGKTLGSTKTFVVKTYLTGDDQKNFDEAFASNKARSVGTSEATRRCLEIGGSARLVDMLPLDPDRVVIARASGVSLVTNYYLYNLKNGDTELLFTGGGSKTPSLFDPRTGKLLAKTEIDPTGDDYEQKIYILNPDSGKFDLQAPLTTRLSHRHTVDLAGRDEQSGKYYVLTDQFSDKVQVRLYDAAAQKFDTEPALVDANYSIAGLIFSTRKQNFNHVVGYVIGGPYLEQVFLDPALKAIQEIASKAFPGQQINISEYTDDFSKVLFTAQSANDPVSYNMVLNDRIVTLGSQRPWIKPGQTGAESWVTYKARDGLEIPAILDLPAGWKQGDAPAPAVVMPHGGPWSRDQLGWDAPGWVPMLTSRGYAVLRPQYRGSAGLGLALWLAGDKEWGLKMSDDLDDGAAWLISQGITRKGDIAIFGYSYGGFAAVAADVRSPSPFQCAIAGAPVANLGRLGTSWSDNRLQRILQGKTVKGMDPMKNTDRAHLPIMLFVGDRDVRTPSWHAEDFYKAVKNKVPAKFYLIPDQQHQMPWYPSQQRETLKLIADFLADDCFTPAAAASAP